MSFFELPEPPPEPPVAHEPEWLGPPDNFLPAPFSLSLLLVRTKQVALQLSSGQAYPNGFEFGLTLRRRDPQRGFGDPFHVWHEAQQSGLLPDDALRFGVEDAEGGKATVFDGHRHFTTTEPPSDAVLVQRGGSGGMRTWQFGFWVWPLPPPGPFRFVVEWPGEGVELTKHAVDANAIREAATRAEELWPETGVEGGRVSSFRIG